MRTSSIARTAVVLAAATVLSQMASADYVFTGATSTNWNVPDNWLENGSVPATYPDGPGVAVNITKDIAAATTINLPSPGVTIGSLTIGDPINTTTPANNFLFAIASNTFTFDSGSAGVNATITKAGFGGSSAARDSINSNVVLNSNLAIHATAVDNSTANSVLRIQGPISGSGGIIKTGNGSISINANNSFTGKTVIQEGRIRFEGSAGSVPLSGDVEIWSGATLQATTNLSYNQNGNYNLPANESIPNNGANGGFVNGGFNGADADVNGTVTGGVILQKLGSLEGTAHGTQVGGGGRGTFEIGYNNLDKTFNGRMGGRVNIVKVGTGVWTLGGTLNNWQQATTLNSQTVNRNITVLGGRVELNKTPHVSSVAQGLLNIGDGTKSGAERPEVRLLQSHQIAVQAFDEAAENELTKMTLNSGVFNTNGQDETVGSLVVAGGGLSTIDLGAGDSVLSFGNSSALAWGQLATLEVLNWSGLTAGGGTDQLFFGTDATGLTATQLDAISFINPAGAAAGAYDAKLLSTGELVPVFAVARIEGDTNGDGVVDLADLNNVLNNFGATGTSPGDDDGNGVVDLADLNRVLNNFGDTAAASALSVVPEPGTLSVLALPALALLGRRRNRR